VAYIDVMRLVEMREGGAKYHGEEKMTAGGGIAG